MTIADFLKRHVAEKAKAIMGSMLRSSLASLRKGVNFIRGVKEPTHRYIGLSFSEWIQEYSQSLEEHEIGLWQLIQHLKGGFGLADNDLIESTRHCLLLLFKKGAKPVVAARAGYYGWRLADYGTTDEAKTASIIQEWLDAKKDPTFWNSVWFVLPRYILKPSNTEGLRVNQNSKLYPGKLYQLPQNNGYVGLRPSNSGRKIIEITHPDDDCLVVCFR